MASRPHSNTSGRGFLLAHQGSMVTISELNLTSVPSTSLLFHCLWQGLGCAFPVFFLCVQGSTQKMHSIKVH